jgi:hypothetical protein
MTRPVARPFQPTPKARGGQAHGSVGAGARPAGRGAIIARKYGRIYNALWPLPSGALSAAEVG